METNSVQSNSSGGAKNIFPIISIVIALVVAEVIFWFVFGSASNFENGDPAEGNPTNLMGLIYKGGWVIPIGLALFLISIIVSVERMVILGKAKGKGSMISFVKDLQIKLEEEQIDDAISLCDDQKASVSNVAKAALEKYKLVSQEMKNEQKGGAKVLDSGETSGNIVVADVADKEQRMLSIQKSIEETAALEIPILEKNLMIIGTIVSIGTLVGLIGTVLGMIKAFQALGTGGSVDPAQLSIGISEALINTAIGITTSTVATVAYNYFTSTVDDMSYKMDEVGLSITQTFASKH